MFSPYKCLIVLVLMLGSVSANAAKHTIGILVYDGVLTSDITAPIEVFGAATKKAWFSNYEVILISTKKQATITTEEGLTITVDNSIADNLELDVLLLPSSYNMGPLLSNPALISFIQQQAKHTEWLASNCSGAFLLAEAGLLDGLKATTWAGGEEELKDDYPAVNVQFDQNVVVDKNVITSNGSVVSYQAALILLEKLSSKQFSQEISEAIQWQRLESAFNR
ncbi:DJ-1/PfpI family protein [Alkalimarinus coralli]|uniref:DJ-1/PfpI family protein n=1 Tax=Alkalimarinus coralli TaxID=2935863 RepID=UPI00202ADD2F|nr:DJ-1/PfpI family protein [Alkalimarinus coralli]